MYVYFVAAAFLGTFVVMLVFRLIEPRPPSGAIRPPLAPRCFPLIGHALAYKRDPAAFLTRACEVCGPVFRINLAGRCFTVVGSDPAAMRQVACASEDVLSARAAVLDIGFEQTLGLTNVTVGTHFHRGVILSSFAGSRLFDEAEPMLRALQHAIHLEFTAAASSGGIVTDFLQLVRRCVLRAVISRLLGEAVMTRLPSDFICSFMAFQDAVESATASAAVLPRWFARLFVLSKVEYQRNCVSSHLSCAIADAWLEVCSSGHGPWLNAFKKSGFRHHDAGELSVGLLFAAHKNPAIGAAQAVLLTLQSTSCLLSQARSAARAAQLQPAAVLNDPNNLLRRVALETCRLTAHAIGAVRKVLRPEGFTFESGKYKFWAGYGDTVALAHITVHRSPRLWGDGRSSREPGSACATAPDAFAPHRSQWDSNPDQYTHTTFSHGVHRCPGEGLALLIIQCILTELLAGAWDCSVEGSMPALSWERATLAQRSSPVAVRVRRRDGSNSELLDDFVGIKP
jgi:cytochrome P450